MIEKYGAILHKRWILREGKLVGYWAEDDSEYEIVVPGQLVPILLDIQNRLCDMYLGIEQAEAEAARMTNSFKSIFGI